MKAAPQNATESAAERRSKVDGLKAKMNDLINFLGADPTGDSISAAKSTVHSVVTEWHALAGDIPGGSAGSTRLREQSTITIWQAEFS